MIATTNSSKLEHPLTDALTGIYISLVLFVLLVFFVSYFLCIFCKKKRLDASKTIDNTSTNHSENLLPNPPNKLCESRKNSEFIDYLIAKQELDSKSIGDDLMISRQSSFMNPRTSKNQLLSSRVSLILLSSAKTQLDNYTISDLSKRNSIETSTKIDQDTVELVKKFLNSPKLDKETANRISFKIAKYYEKNRKIDSLSSIPRQSLSRSRSIASLNTDNNNNNNNNRKSKLRVSFKNYVHSPISSNHNDEFKRKWKSERTHTNRKNMSQMKQMKLLESNEKKIEKKKPTTIYELYRSNKMQISNLFTNYDDE